MNKSIKTADDSNKLILKESKGCVFFRLFPFCRICKDKDLSPKEIQNSQNAFLQRESNYMRNNILNINKTSTENEYQDPIIEKRSLLKKQSIFASYFEFSDEIESYSENEIFFLKKTCYLIITRIVPLNIKNYIKLKQSSKSFTLKSNGSLIETFKLFELISVLPDKVVENLSNKFKDNDSKLIMCLDVKTSIQVNILI